MIGPQAVINAVATQVNVGSNTYQLSTYQPMGNNGIEVVVRMHTTSHGKNTGQYITVTVLDGQPLTAQVNAALDAAGVTHI